MEDDINISTPTLWVVILHSKQNKKYIWRCSHPFMDNNDNSDYLLINILCSLLKFGIKLQKLILLMDWWGIEFRSDIC